MTTATTPAPRSAPDDSPIYHPLDRLRGTIRKFVIVDGLLTAALFLLVWFWVGLAVDFGVFKLTGFDWVQDAPTWLRVAGLLAAVAVVAVIVALRVAVRLRTEFSYPSLALVLEKRFPNELGDRLITAVELADVKQQEKYGYSGEMIRHTIDAARERVGKLPVETVFNWRRLKNRAGVFVAAGLVMLGVSFGLFAAFGTGSTGPAAFANEFYDTAMIWTERNVFVQNTPWPRRAFIEVIEPVDLEHRIGKDAPPPAVKARAAKWVVVDRTNWAGWRPATWEDLPRVYGSGAPSLDAVVPPSVALTSSNPRLDEVEAAAEPGSPVFAKLDEIAARPSMSRTFRKLVVPTDVTLSYTGLKTGGSISLTREPTGDFTGTVTGLKESVGYKVRGEDFATQPREITLVPPPMLTKLMRTEYKPAYEYYPAPVVNGQQDFGALKGLRQVFRDKDMSLTGDKSVFTVPAGTELDITGIADKKLKEVTILPKLGRVPGGDATAPKRIPVPVDGDKFTVAFRGPDAPTANTEFEVTMTDFDNVTASKGVLIQVTEDKAPEVEVGVDVLRKAGNVYLCTPIARVPFLPDSVVRDDKGLSKVEYEYTSTKQESASMLGQQGGMVAGVWASAPTFPDFGALLGTVVRVNRAEVLIKPETATKRMPVQRFADEYAGLPKDTLDRLRGKLNNPLPEDGAVVVKSVKFQDPTLDSFELERALPSIRVIDSGDLQPRYRVDLNVVATDTNVETGPKSSRNVEPIRLLIIPEQDLLAEMSKEEDQLLTRLEDVLKKAEEAKRKMQESRSRMAAPSPPADLFESVKVRVLDLTQDLGKSKDLLTTALTDYKRLEREARVNQCNPRYIDRLQAETIRPIDKVLTARFPEAERTIAEVQSVLNTNTKPSEAQLAAANAELDQLTRELKAIIDAIGEQLSIDKFRNQLQDLINKQREVTVGLKRIYDLYQIRQFLPSIAASPAVTLNKGEKKAMKHAINWKVYDKDDLKVKIAATPGSEVAVPAEVVIPNDGVVNSVDYEIAAGQKAGKFEVTLTPAVGEPVVVEVTVK